MASVNTTSAATTAVAAAHNTTTSTAAAATTGYEKKTRFVFRPDTYIGSVNMESAPAVNMATAAAADDDTTITTTHGSSVPTSTKMSSAMKRRQRKNKQQTIHYELVSSAGRVDVVDVHRRLGYGGGEKPPVSVVESTTPTPSSSTSSSSETAELPPPQKHTFRRRGYNNNNRRHRAAPLECCPEEYIAAGQCRILSDVRELHQRQANAWDAALRGGKCATVADLSAEVKRCQNERYMFIVAQMSKLSRCCNIAGDGDDEGNCNVVSATGAAAAGVDNGDNRNDDKHGGDNRNDVIEVGDDGGGGGGGGDAGDWSIAGDGGKISKKHQKILSRQTTAGDFEAVGPTAGGVVGHLHHHQQHHRRRRLCNTCHMFEKMQRRMATPPRYKFSTGAQLLFPRPPSVKQLCLCGIVSDECAFRRPVVSHEDHRLLEKCWAASVAMAAPADGSGGGGGGIGGACPFSHPGDWTRQARWCNANGDQYRDLVIIVTPPAAAASASTLHTAESPPPSSILADAIAAKTALRPHPVPEVFTILRRPVSFPAWRIAEIATSSVSVAVESCLVHIDMEDDDGGGGGGGSTTPNDDHGGGCGGNIGSTTSELPQIYNSDPYSQFGRQWWGLDEYSATGGSAFGLIKEIGVVDGATNLGGIQTVAQIRLAGRLGRQYGQITTPETTPRPLMQTSATTENVAVFARANVLTLALVWPSHPVVQAVASLTDPECERLIDAIGTTAVGSPTVLCIDYNLFVAGGIDAQSGKTTATAAAGGGPSSAFHLIMRAIVFEQIMGFHRIELHPAAAVLLDVVDTHSEVFLSGGLANVDVETTLEPLARCIDLMNEAQQQQSPYMCGSEAEFRERIWMMVVHLCSNAEAAKEGGGDADPQLSDNKEEEEEAVGGGWGDDDDEEDEEDADAECDEEGAAAEDLYNSVDYYGVAAMAAGGENNGGNGGGGGGIGGDDFFCNSYNGNLHHNMDMYNNHTVGGGGGGGDFYNNYNGGINSHHHNMYRENNAGGVVEAGYAGYGGGGCGGGIVYNSNNNSGSVYQIGGGSSSLCSVSEYYPTFIN